MSMRCGLKKSKKKKKKKIHSGSRLERSNGSPRDGIFNPHLIPMKDTYSLAHGLRQLTGDVKSGQLFTLNVSFAPI